MFHKAFPDTGRIITQGRTGMANGFIPTALALFLMVALVPMSRAAIGEALSHQKISDIEGGFLGALADDDRFGTAAAILNDLDGDGVPDMVVGTPGDDDGGADKGAAWILFLDTDGTVRNEQKISELESGFTGRFDEFDRFGSAVVSLGDLDGYGVVDIAVGAYQDDDGGLDRGAVWILFLNTDGTVKSHQKISDLEGGFTGGLADDNRFGAAAANLGDLDGDFVTELAVGAYWDNDGGSQRGAVWILFLNTDGTVKSQQKISDTEGGFTGVLDDFDRFGAAVAAIGDLDGDDVTDLVVGAYQDDDGGLERGAAWILFLNTDGTVKAHQKISDTEGGFTGLLDDDDRFCSSVASVNDLDADGVRELAVGAYRDGDGGPERGAVWILFLNTDGTVKSHQKISDTEGSFNGGLLDEDRFGSCVASPADLDGDFVPDLAAGAYRDNDGGVRRGAVYFLFLDGIPNGLVSAEMICAPSSGTLPFTTKMAVTMANNYTGLARSLAGRVDVRLASGMEFNNWRSGHTSVAAGGNHVLTWSQDIPALGSLLGDNLFSFSVQDVTPSPFNQPPYPRAGDADSDDCTVTGIAP